MALDVKEYLTIITDQVNEQYQLHSQALAKADKYKTQEPLKFHEANKKSVEFVNYSLLKADALIAEILPHVEDDSVLKKQTLFTALHFYDLAAEFDTTSSKLYFYRGRLHGLLEQELLEKADFDFASYLLAEEEPKSIDDCLTRITYREYMDNLAPHFSREIKYLRSFARTAEDWYHVGSLQYAFAHIDAAIKAYEVALLIEPNHIKAHNELSALYYDNGDEEKGKAHSEKYVELIQSKVQ